MGLVPLRQRLEGVIGYTLKRIGIVRTGSKLLLDKKLFSTNETIGNCAEKYLKVTQKKWMD